MAVAEECRLVAGLLRFSGLGQPSGRTALISSLSPPASPNCKTIIRRRYDLSYLTHNNERRAAPGALPEPTRPGGVRDPGTPAEAPGAARLPPPAGRLPQG